MGAAYDRYRKRVIVPFQMALNRNTDSDILRWLDERENKTGSIKALIRAEIAREEAREGVKE